jgi:hypothetical protein
LWIVLVACSEDPSPPTPEFAGVGAVTWDRADGLLVGWLPLQGATYTVQIFSPQGELVTSLSTEEPSGAVTGLAEGEYLVRVQAERGEFVSDGGREIAQWVGANRLVLRSHVEIAEAASVWGEGDIVVLAGRDSGASFYVFDISDPREPELLYTEHDGGYVKEVKLLDGLMYTQGECGCSADSPAFAYYDKVGVRIWDLADPRAPVLLSEISEPTATVHNLWVEDGYLYAADNQLDGFRVFDVHDPTAPFEVGQWLAPQDAFVHDQAVVRGRLYASWWQGVTVLDVTDPTNMREIGTFTGAVPALHNAWPTEDDRYVLTTSETPGGRVTVLDFADPLAPVLVTDIEGKSPTSSSHNVHVKGQYAFTAWYTEGLVVHDLTDPRQPREVGRYNTMFHEVPGPPSSERTMGGAWGVWPYGEHVVVGDSVRGLFVFDFFPDTVELW